MVLVGFWINDPSKIGCFHQHWKNFDETLPFKDLAVKKFISFLLQAYFCEKNPEFLPKAFFMNGSNI